MMVARAGDRLLGPRRERDRRARSRTVLLETFEQRNERLANMPGGKRTTNPPQTATEVRKRLRQSRRYRRTKCGRARVPRLPPPVQGGTRRPDHMLESLPRPRPPRPPRRPDRRRRHPDAVRPAKLRRLRRAALGPPPRRAAPRTGMRQTAPARQRPDHRHQEGELNVHPQNQPRQLHRPMARRRSQPPTHLRHVTPTRNAGTTRPAAAASSARSRRSTAPDRHPQHVCHRHVGARCTPCCSHRAPARSTAQAYDQAHRADARRAASFTRSNPQSSPAGKSPCSPTATRRSARPAPCSPRSCKRPSRAKMIATNAVRLVRATAGAAPRRGPAARARPPSRRSEPSLDHRDRVLVSLLAYAGLRPERPAPCAGGTSRSTRSSIGASKTGQRRTVRLLDPLAHDLRAWQARRADAPVIGPAS